MDEGDGTADHRDVPIPSAQKSKRAMAMRSTDKIEEWMIKHELGPEAWCMSGLKGSGVPLAHCSLRRLPMVSTSGRQCQRFASPPENGNGVCRGRPACIGRDGFNLHWQLNLNLPSDPRSTVGSTMQLSAIMNDLPLLRSTQVWSMVRLAVASLH